MADVSLHELAPPWQTLANQARTAWEQGDLDYALDVSAQLLQEVPGCWTVRKLQRGVQRQKGGGGAGWGGRIQRWLRRIKPTADRSAIASGDAVLAVDPFNRSALRQLAAIARTNEWIETELFAWESLCEVGPTDRDSGVRLTNRYLAVGRIAEATVAAERLANALPRDQEVRALGQKVIVAQTMKTGNWEADGTFRDKLRD